MRVCCLLETIVCHWCLQHDTRLKTRVVPPAVGVRALHVMCAYNRYYSAYNYVVLLGAEESMNGSLVHLRHPVQEATIHESSAQSAALPPTS